MVFCNKKLPIIRATNRPKYANRSFIVPCISPTKIRQMLCFHPFCEHPPLPSYPQGKILDLVTKATTLLPHTTPQNPSR